MKVYVDSSYAVAYFVAHHPDHQRAKAFFANETEAVTLVCSAHATAEMYVAMVKRRGTTPPMMPASDAEALLSKVVPKTIDIRPIALADYRRTLQLAPAIPVENALLYDLLHCVCADAVGTDELWTLNGRDFTRLQSVTKAQIRVPPQQ